MDTLIFLVSTAAVVVILGYGAFWTVRAVRRVALHRFAAALGQLVRALVVALFRMQKPVQSGEPTRSGDTPSVDTFNYLVFIRPTQEEKPGFDPFHFGRDKSEP